MSRRIQWNATLTILDTQPKCKKRKLITSYEQQLGWVLHTNFTTRHQRFGFVFFLCLRLSKNERDPYEREPIVDNTILLQVWLGVPLLSTSTWLQRSGVGRSWWSVLVEKSTKVGSWKSQKVDSGICNVLFSGR